MADDRVLITVHGDGGRHLTFRATKELAGLLDLTAQINSLTRETFHYSFSAMLLGLMYGPHQISKWFSGFVSETQVDRSAIVRAGGLENRERDLERIAGSSGFNYPNGERTGTRSALDWLEKAKSFSEEQSNDWIGLRHLIGALAFDPELHKEDLERWKLSRARLATEYLKYIERRHPEDLQFWKGKSEATQANARRPNASNASNAMRSGDVGAFQAVGAVRAKKPSTPPPAVDTPPLKSAPSANIPALERAPSTHITTDSWTVDDTLGHFAYARAIYRFITHDKTEAPLAVSIQAPWGGGKTSLMRMVQRELDPEAVDKLVKDRELRRKRDPVIPDTREKSEFEAILVSDVLAEIGRKTKGGATREPSVPVVRLPAGERRLTVWFNAWKYESTEQVWAGLADSILRQVCERMPLREQQLFWFRLQLLRVNGQKIQQAIVDRIWNEWWRFSKAWIGALGSLTVALIAAELGGHQWYWTSGIVLSVSTTMGLTISKYFGTKKDVEKEPAEVSLKEYLQVPDYRGKAGFIHEVAEDLNRIMKAIPGKLPLVVFIDDLDRCSPEKVAAVTEGINLFLAGEFPNCIFVLGMDAEMVAAALEEAHAEVIAKLPSYADYIPIGWRFMDKFVQLPFVIPPPEPKDIEQYVESLFVDKDQEKQRSLPEEVITRIEGAARQPEHQAMMAAIPEAELFVSQQPLSEPQRKEAERRLDQIKTVASIDAEISRALHDDALVREFVKRFAPDFSSNPRDLKRFLNTFRLYDFQRIARQERALAAPSRHQIAKWIVLSLKWPQVVRWMQRTTQQTATTEETKAQPSLAFRLTQLEAFAAEASEKDSQVDAVERWTELLQSALGPTGKTLAWTSDPALYRFFSEESEEEQKLSAGAGKGLW